MTSPEDQPFETRAERRRRMRELEERAAADLPDATAHGPYDLRPYGVHAYRDIEDAVVEDEEGPRAPRSYVAPPVATAHPSPAPLASLADADDSASAAAALQLIAARAAAERLVGTPRPAISARTEAADARDQLAAERERLAAERLAAGKVAAARLAAVRAAAGGRTTGTTAAAIAAAPAAGPRAASGTTAARTPAPPQALPPGATGATTTSATTTATTSATRPAVPPSRPAPGRTAAAAGRTGPARLGGLVRPVAVWFRDPRTARVAYPAAAVAVLGVGAVLTVPAVLSMSSPSTPASAGSVAATGSAAATDGPSPSASPGASPTAAADATSAGVATCDPTSWASRLAGDSSAAAAVNEFTPEGVAQAYCGAAGTLRSLGFTDLAVRRPANRPYSAADFAPMAEHLSPALRSRWSQDVADLVRTQQPTSDAGRRISALTRLAWDNSALRWDPAAPARATDFAVGRPVTWTAKGADGVTRLGLGFETGVVTHMLDAAGRPQGQILKRTYKLALVKGSQAHPWLIDAYEVGEATAKLSTTTVTPGGSASTRG